MEKIFKFSTIIILIALLLSSLFHVMLLASDSPEYRYWVMIQITLQLAGAGLLFFVSKFSLLAFGIFSVLSIPFVIINAKYINYGHDELHTVFATLFWFIYGGILFKVRNKFIKAGQP